MSERNRPTDFEFLFRRDEARIAELEAERDWLADPQNVVIGYTKQENLERALAARHEEEHGRS